MKIIDSHLHIFPESDDAPAACQAEPLSALRCLWEPLEIIHGVVMGNRSLAPEYHNYPAELLRRQALSRLQQDPPLRFAVPAHLRAGPVL